ncbi:hypothetical protein VNO77_37320 [Canavalia gladiata]|uniref:Uncharacterized protein n=1 Tax=Canavalia gladiata TaxID=3824 RepID=A0AAN9KAZ8_CANGL
MVTNVMRLSPVKKVTPLAYYFRTQVIDEILTSGPLRASIQLKLATLYINLHHSAGQCSDNEGGIHPTSVAVINKHYGPEPEK